MTGVRQDVVLFAEDWYSGASTWSTQRPEAHCRYLAEWEDMKLRHAPSADEAEAAALREVADGCPQTVMHEPKP